MSISEMIAKKLKEMSYRISYKKVSRLKQSDILKMKEKRDIEGLIKVCRYLKYAFSTSPQGLIYKEAIKALGDLEDLRAAEILIDGLDSNSIWPGEASKSLIKLNAIEATIMALDLYDSEIKKNAIKILGNLMDVRSVEPLIKLLNSHYENEDVRKTAYRVLKKFESSKNIDDEMSKKLKAIFLQIEKEKEALKTQIERDKLAELKEIEDVSNMTDQDMINLLANLCQAYSNNNPSYKELEPQARKIGKLLNRRGGLKEMRRIFDQLNSMPGSRTLEMHWNGIGEWLG